MTVQEDYTKCQNWVDCHRSVMNFAIRDIMSITLIATRLMAIIMDF